MSYNNLPHIRDAERYEMPKIVQIQKVIQKYHFEQQILVYRLHKHFDLQADQKVVWTYSQSKSISQVLKGENYSPCVFMFDKQGKMQPTQFYQGPNKWEQIKLRQNFDLLQSQISKIIQGEQQIYGLIFKLTGYEFELEITNEESRTQQIFPIQKIDQEECDQNVSATKFQKSKVIYGVCCYLS